MSFRSNNTTTIFYALGQFILLSLLVALSILIVKTDVHVLKNGLSEQSLTEYTESILLSATVLCYVFVAVKAPLFRRVAVLIAGFFTCLLIREFDLFFDQLIWHGFWIYPALFVAASALLYTLADRQSTLNGLTYFVQSRHYPLLCFGLVLLLVFSRLLGMSSLWHDVLGNGYIRTAKNVAEEGTELMAYFIILYSSIQYAFSICHSSSPTKNTNTFK